MIKKLFLWSALAGLATASLSAGEKSYLHCFYFTSVPSAAKADWNAFFSATDALTGKIQGLRHVWYGKLTRPMESDPPRDWGVCMEFQSEAARNTYGNATPHGDWEKAYFKVRQAGTTTVDFMGQ